MSPHSTSPFVNSDTPPHSTYSISLCNSATISSSGVQPRLVNTPDVNVKYLSYKSSRNGAIHFKVIAYTKSTDGTYKIITDKGLNQVISIYYNRLDSKVRLYVNPDYNYANSF